MILNESQNHKIKFTLRDCNIYSLAILFDSQPQYFGSDSKKKALYSIADNLGIL